MYIKVSVEVSAALKSLIDDGVVDGEDVLTAIKETVADTLQGLVDDNADNLVSPALAAHFG